MKLKIRKYTDSDKEELIHLLRLNTPLYFSQSEEKDFIYYLNNFADNYYVVLLENLIVGCGGFNMAEDKETAKISWDIIHPEKHGLGIGSRLMHFRIGEIKKIAGIKVLSVRTSQLVYKFYEKFGLQLREVIKDYWDKGFDLYRLDSPIHLVKSGD